MVPSRLFIKLFVKLIKINNRNIVFPSDMVFQGNHLIEE